jgi:hypothetical protein
VGEGEDTIEGDGEEMEGAGGDGGGATDFRGRLAGWAVCVPGFRFVRRDGGVEGPGEGVRTGGEGSGGGNGDYMSVNTDDYTRIDLRTRPLEGAGITDSTSGTRGLAIVCLRDAGPVEIACFSYST